MELKTRYISQVFEGYLPSLKVLGIYFSGFQGEGEYKKWYENGQLKEHLWLKNSLSNGERKEWYSDGKILNHYWADGGEAFSIPKNKKLKDGYILGGDGKYYKD